MSVDERIDADDAELRGGTSRTNLRADVSALVGRDTDRARVLDLLGTHRLTTLVGAGGVGKTRLAVDAARRLLPRFADGVWFVEFAPLRTADHVVAALASLFAIEETPGRQLVDSVVDALRTKSLLLVLDNCEHVLGPLAAAAGALLAACPGVRVLATSRERLGIDGEATYRVPPLETPAGSAQLRVADALSFPAIRLFVDRARAANDRFALGDANVAAVADICRRLDGIALAIELAAARVRFLNVEHIASLLDERFRLLSDPDRRTLPHHQTLRATLDWSYHLLGDVERILLGRLAIFAGSFSLDAILAVCGDDGLDTAAIFGALSTLVDKSLVAFEAHQRYRLLETVREYAREALVAGSGRDPVAHRHAAFFRALAEHVSLIEGTLPYRAWLAPLEADLDNLRAALHWTLGESGDVICGAAIAAAFVETSSLGRWTEWAEWNERALAALPPGAPDGVLGRLLTRRSELAARYGAFGGNTTALDAATQAKMLLAESEPRWQLEAHNAHAIALVGAGRTDDSLNVARGGLELARATGDAVYQASFLRQIGTLLAADEPAAARVAFEESIRLCRELENDFGLALSLHAASRMHFALGDGAEAILAIETACAIRREMNDRRGLAAALGDEAGYLLLVGRRDDAAPALGEALEIVESSEDARGIAIVAERAAFYALLGDDEPAARTLARFAADRYVRLGAPRDPLALALRSALVDRLAALPGGPEAGIGAPESHAACAMVRAMLEAVAFKMPSGATS